MVERNSQMQRPGFENKVNINTIMLFLTLLGTGIGWGVNYQAIKSGQKVNADNITRIERETIPEIRSSIAQIQSDARNYAKQNETDARAYANIEFRVGRLEDGFVTVTANTRDLEKTINGMASDIRVMREILSRLDKPERDGTMRQ